MAQLEGLDKYLTGLVRMIPQPEQVNKAIRPFAEELAEEMRMRVPVDQGIVKDAIAVIKRKKAQYVDVGIDYDKLNNKRPSNIAWLLEFGHAGPNDSVVPPKPFIRPAFEARKNDLIAGMQKAIMALAEKNWEEQK